MQEKGKPGKNDSLVDCCPSSGYLVSRIMAELFIVSLIQIFFKKGKEFKFLSKKFKHCPDFSSTLPRCNQYAEQVKQTGLYVVAQDLSNFIKT